ncbi:hypothetical protein HK096_004751 [Nowakowskiella sp. JEL0078]|nr:hypothetical protein HK096_004751 [Nowakowskiella sp. JEL0078]
MNLNKRVRRTTIAVFIFVFVVSALLYAANSFTVTIKRWSEEEFKKNITRPRPKNANLNLLKNYTAPMKGNRCAMIIGKGYPHQGGFGCRDGCGRDGLKRDAYSRSFYSPIVSNDSGIHNGWPLDFTLKVKKSIEIMQSFGLKKKDVLWIPRFEDLKWKEDEDSDVAIIDSSAAIPSGGLHLSGSYHCCLTEQEFEYVDSNWANGIKLQKDAKESKGSALAFQGVECALERPGIISISLIVDKPTEYKLNNWLNELQDFAVKQSKVSGLSKKWDTRFYSLTRGHENRILFALFSVASHKDINRFYMENAIDNINALAENGKWSNEEMWAGLPQGKQD